ncbi:hypothetical protein DFR70_109147 [Nocardia tenerifensis]|uniref:Secreted protein n=2 Tax=Nocardia tenerifensis TaxID=228006 RepID=A0A318K0U5_9NOCA|nr:hypothetical protein DFR70_109147 [Nocardia tenerifensis]
MNSWDHLPILATVSVARAARRRVLFVAGLWLLLATVGMAGASADSAAAGADVSVAQSLGDRELTIVLRRVTSVPGPLRVDVVTHAGTAPGRLALAVTPTGPQADSSLPVAGAPTARGVVELGGTPGMYSATLDMDRPGPWELAIDDGARVARIPFVVPAQVTSPPERLVYLGFVVAGVLLPVSVVIAVRAERSAWALLPAGGMVAGVAVSVTAALLSASLPLPPQPGGQVDPTVDTVTDPYSPKQPMISDYSRPPVLLTVEGSVTAGRPGDLDLVVLDAATGAPADDLLVHDSALMHLLVVAPGGGLSHLHPIRVAPGRYRIHLTAPEAGRYAVSAEVARRCGGVQMVRAPSGFVALPDAAAPPVKPSVPLRLGGADKSASMVLDGTSITVEATDAVAGEPTTITAKVGDTADLQPWLGMVGHLIMAGPLPDGSDIAAAVANSPVWGHAHSMGPTSMPDMPGMSGGHDMKDMSGGHDVPGTSSRHDLPGQRGGQDMPGMGSGHDMPGMSGEHDMPGQHDTGTTARGVMLMPPVNGESPPDETVAAYGPDAPFTFTFPIAGRYRLWIQVERDYTVLTVPIVLDVAPGAHR